MLPALFIALATLAATDELQQAPRPAPKPASTSPFSYTYLQLDVVAGDGDDFHQGPTGFDLRGAYALKDNLFLTGELSKLGGDVAGDNKDVDSIGIGIGMHVAVDAHADFVFGLSLLHAHSETGTPDSSPDGNGYRIEGGVRYLLDTQMEVSSMIGFTDYSDSDSNLSIDFGGLLHMTHNLGLSGDFELSEHFLALSFGLRWQP